MDTACYATQIAVLSSPQSGQGGRGKQLNSCLPQPKMVPCTSFKYRNNKILLSTEPQEDMAYNEDHRISLSFKVALRHICHKTYQVQ